MSSQILKLSLLFCLLFLFYDMAFAQTQPIDSASANDKWLRCANAGKWDSAIYYAKVLEASSKKNYGEISFEHAVFLTLYLGHTYAASGDASSAYHYLKQGIDIFKKLNTIENPQYKEAVFFFGMVCTSIGSNTEAENYLTKAANIYKSTNVYYYTQSILNLATIYIIKGEYAKAEQLNMSVQEILDTAPKTAFCYYLIASSQNNIALIYTKTGNIQKALSFTNKSLFYMQKSRDLENKDENFADEDLIEVLLNLADAYINSGFQDSALLLCKRVEDSLTIKKDDGLYAKLLKEKALIYQSQNRLNEAIQLNKRYKIIADKLLKRPDDYDATLINLGSLYTKTGQLTIADSLFGSEARKLRRTGLEFSYEMQQALAGLCAELIDQNRYTEAEDTLIGLCHLTFKVMNKNFYGMPEDEKLKYKNGLDEIFNLIYICLYTSGIVAKSSLAEIYNLELQRSSQVLLEESQLLERVRNSQDTGLSSLYQIWLNNKEILSKQYSLPVYKRKFNTDSLENVCEKLERKVSTKENSQNIANYDSAVPTILQNQKSGSASIEFVHFNYKTLDGLDTVLYAALISKSYDSVPDFVELCSEKALMKLMKNRKGELEDEDQLTQKLYNNRSSSATELYRMIWKPLEPYLRNIRNIDYTTSGLLNNIAFHALYNGRNYLLKKYAFRRFFSLINKDQENISHQKPQSISIWGNMNYDSAVYNHVASQPPQNNLNNHFFILPPNVLSTSQIKGISKSRLQPFDTTEVYQLRKIFSHNKINTTIYQYGYATEENFKQQASLQKGIVHISTHGFYSSLNKDQSKALLPDNFISGIVNPLFRCGLAFSGVNYYWLKGIAKEEHDDGILTGYEVAQLDLHNVQLVTLSACESGLGDVTDKEGNLGLQHAFKLAGVHKMLVSLWHVPAKQTVELLALFYDYWLNGKSISEALQKAEYTMQKKGYPPYYWAGFVLIE
jgi:CHAT domain-containing protein